MNLFETSCLGFGLGWLLLMSGCQSSGIKGDTSTGEVADAQKITGYADWPESKLSDPDFFPVMVWAQDPELAPQYKALGINTFFSLHEGPTEKQLATLGQHGLYTVCAQNEAGLRHLDNPTIIAWMHGDEPDNRQAQYDDGPVPLDKILTDYSRIVNRDPRRPVVVNFGQGVANPQFSGRGIEYDAYPQYARGADILSYDVYPVANLKYLDMDAEGEEFTNMRDDGGELLYLVAEGINRLEEWGDHDKPVWNVLECTAIWHPRGMKVTPHQIRAQFWMSIIHGSRGICWFVHDFRPGHRDVAALLSDPELMEAVRKNNEQVQSLARVIHSPDRNELVEVRSTDGVPVDVLVKKSGGKLYVFAASMRNQPTSATFTVYDPAFEDASLEVLGEDRRSRIEGAEFTDQFEGFGVHLYRLSPHIP